MKYFYRLSCMENDNNNYKEGLEHSKDFESLEALFDDFLNHQHYYIAFAKARLSVHEDNDIFIDMFQYEDEDDIQWLACIHKEHYGESHRYYVEAVDYENGEREQLGKFFDLEEAKAFGNKKKEEMVLATPNMLESYEEQGFTICEIFEDLKQYNMKLFKYMYVEIWNENECIFYDGDY